MSFVKQRSGSWSGVAIGMHWITALAVFGLYWLGWYMVDLDYYDDWYRSAPHWHKSIGLTLAALVIVRLMYRVVAGTPKPLPSHARWEQVLARLMHILFYLLLLTIFVSGYLISTADGRGIEVFSFFELPALVTGCDRLEDDAGVVHVWATNAILILAGIHAAAALKHHFIDRDATLLRMLGRKTN